MRSRCGPLSRLDYLRIRSRHAVQGSWTALVQDQRLCAGDDVLRCYLVGGHVQCDCERHGTLIKIGAHYVMRNERSYNSSLPVRRGTCVAAMFSFRRPYSISKPYAVSDADQNAKARLVSPDTPPVA